MKTWFIKSSYSSSNENIHKCIYSLLKFLILIKRHLLHNSFLVATIAVYCYSL